MNIIKNIELDEANVKMHLKGNKMLNIPIRNEYVNGLVLKAVEDNTQANKDIIFFNKCSKIALIPLYIAVLLFIFAFLSETLLLGITTVICSIMGSVGIISSLAIKSYAKHLEKKANNNRYWTKLCEEAMNGFKEQKQENIRTKSNIIENEFSRKGNEIIQDRPINSYNNSSYNMTRDKIIQDEVVNHKTR